MVIVSVIVCSLSLKDYGVMLSFTVSDIVVMIMIYLYYAYQKKDFKVTVDDYLLLEDDFSNAQEETIEIDIYDKSDCTKVSNEVKQLCLRHHASKQQTQKGELCAEEGSILLLEIASKSTKRFDKDVLVKLNASYSNNHLRLHYRFYDKNISLMKEMNNLKEKKVSLFEDAFSEKILSGFASEMKTYKTVDIENLYIVI